MDNKELLKAIGEMIDNKLGEIDSRFEKIDSRFEKIDSRFEQMDSKFEEIKNELKENTNSINKLEAKIESEISDKIRGLYDTREVTTDKLNSIDDKIDDIKIDINNISIRTLHNDNRLIKLVKDKSKKVNE